VGLYLVGVHLYVVIVTLRCDCTLVWWCGVVGGPLWCDPRCEPLWQLCTLCFDPTFTLDLVRYIGCGFS